MLHTSYCIQSDDRFCKPKYDSGPTRFLYVAGIGDELHSDVDTLVRFFSKFGALDDRYVDGDGIEKNRGDVDIHSDVTVVTDYSNIRNAICMVPNRRYIYVCYLSVQSATAALAYIRSTKDWMSEDICVNKLCANYAEERVTMASKHADIECTSATAHVHVPGCYLVNDFITIEEENVLLTDLAGESALWRGDLNRRVQVSESLSSISIVLS